MYLSATTHSLEILSDSTATTTEPMYGVAYNDHTSAGMTLPQSSTQGSLTGTTVVTVVAAPGASTTRQIAHLTVYNADTVTRIITVQKDVSGTNVIVVKASLASGATLQFSRENGWTVLNTGTGQESVIFTTFTANGTWNKPSTLKRLIVCCIGAGGGGGSGRCDAAGTNRFGGGGGGGGAIVWRLLAPSDLATTVAVTVGTGGTGGTGVSTVNTNGNSGSVGGNTSFGAILIATGGNGGSGGTSTNGTNGSGGSASSSTPQFGPYCISGANGGSGSSGSGIQATSGMTGNQGCPGGSGGGGINSGNTNATSGGVGGGVYANGLFISGPTSGATPNGLDNQSNFLLFSSSLTSGLGIGTGGAGGYPSLPANAGNGGNYGAGGGGGRASLTGTASGAGGNGGGGLVTILEIY